MATPEDEARDALTDVRARATVALLAAGLLVRGHLHAPDAERLGRRALDALQAMARDLQRLDAALARLEDRERMRADPPRLRPWLRGDRGGDDGTRGA